MEKEIKSAQELVSLAEENAPWAQYFNLHNDSIPGQFPYKFSFSLAGDRYQFELTQNEVEELSKEPDLAAAVRIAFSLKIAPIVRGRVNFFQ